MPMHYPPLSDGTYRYGDPPRPLPSPVPGPDPSDDGPAGTGPSGPHSAYGDPAGVAAPGVTPSHLPCPPSGEVPEQRRSGGAAAAAIIGVSALVVVVVLGLALFGPASGRGPGPQGFPSAGPPPAGAPGVPGSATFSVEGRFTVIATPEDPVSGDGSGCRLPVSLSDIGEGTAISLTRTTGTLLGTDMLAYDGGDLSSCTFTFEFGDVPAGAGVYLIELPGRGQLTYTEEELRAGVDITLGR